MKQETMINAASMVIVMVIFLATSALIFTLVDVNPLKGFGAIIVGAFGRIDGVSESLARTIPIMFASLGILIAFKGGLWNVGAEGQFYMGAVGATYAALFISAPRPLHIILVMLFAFITAALWGAIAGILKVKFGASEILTTLMLNYVAIWITHYLCFGPWRDPVRVIAATAWFPETARFSRIIPGLRIHSGVFWALALAFLVYLLFKYTRLGQNIQVLGANINTAHYAGINVRQNIIAVMLLSGGIAGLAGAAEVSGIFYSLRNGNYPISPGYGYYAIGAAMLGNLSVPGTILSSFLFGALITGASYLKLTTGLHAHSVDFIVGILLLAILSRRVFIAKLGKLIIAKKNKTDNLTGEDEAWNRAL